MANPKIIQGGMGMGVSTYNLARVVSAVGHLGTVSGTAVELLMVRTLQNGDPGGYWRNALSHFPNPEISERIIERYFIAGGKPKDGSYANIPFFTVSPAQEAIELVVCASFSQVWLAKAGHNQPVAVNLLAKIAMPIAANIFGCMLAGIDYILIGAGIPMQIPLLLDGLEKMAKVTYEPYVAGAPSGARYPMTFDPRSVISNGLKSLKRPKFIPIITSDILATSMAKKMPGKIDGFIIEGPSAGGHNAPPRGKKEIGADGQLVYGEKDEPDLKKVRDLGLPFWLAGSMANAEGAKRVKESGASGIQAGTIFALCNESGFDEQYKTELRRLAYRGELRVFDDILASPTGFLFKVAGLPGSLADDVVYNNRLRVCNIGQLRHLFVEADGSIGYRCPAEPIGIYLAKGGKAEEANGRKCLCNALAANIGLGQVQGNTGTREQPLITLGRDYSFVRKLMKKENDSYSALDAIQYLESLLGER